MKFITTLVILSSGLTDLAFSMPTSAGAPLLRTGTRSDGKAPRFTSTPTIDTSQSIEDDSESDSAIQNMIDGMAAAAIASHLAKMQTPEPAIPDHINGSSRAKRSLDDVVDLNSMMNEEIGGDTVIEKRGKRPAPTCLGSSATDLQINAAFFYGGAGTTVWLCPRSTIKLTNSVFFTAANQTLATQGLPTDSSRAKLVVTGPTQSNAIFGGCNDCSGVTISNIEVLGQRDVLGWIEGGLALIEMGGVVTGQVVRQVKASEPRGWSVLHAIEGTDLLCDSMLIENNQIGPSGNAPNTGLQFRGKRAAVVIPPGQWADGISLACKNSIVRNNVVTDATDGGIVIFGAPGSTISGNIIKNKNRRALGGINAVDYAPFDGSYEGTVVEGNTLITQGTMMKVGLAIGGMVWGSDNRTASRGSSGLFQSNRFQSLRNGYFGYAIAVAGHESATILSNDVSQAKVGGSPSPACIPDPMIPNPSTMIRDQWTTPDAIIQDGFVQAPLVFLICSEPGPIVSPLRQAPSSVPSPSTTTTTTTLAASPSPSPSPAPAQAQAYVPMTGFVGVGVEPNVHRRIKRDGDDDRTPPKARATPKVPSIGFLNPFDLLETKAKRLI